MDLIKDIWKGKTMIRIMMNDRCRTISLKDKKVLDIGSGSKMGSYHDFFIEKSDDVVTSDMKDGENNHRQLDFEKDNLPFEDGEFDTVLSFNLFEHIFNYNHLIGEINRVTKKEGELIGFVPFLLNYHPDPHDYFRYTKDSLEKIFNHNGYSKISIEEIGNGPFTVNYNNVVLSVPKIFRVLLLPFPLILDKIFLKFRPAAKDRYPLGYFFIAKK